MGSYASILDHATKVDIDLIKKFNLINVLHEIETDILNKNFEAADEHIFDLEDKFDSAMDVVNTSVIIGTIYNSFRCFKNYYYDIDLLPESAKEAYEAVRLLRDYVCGLIF